MARGVMLMSGGIDSPVALNYLLRQGHELLAVHLDNRPFTDDSPLGKVVDHLTLLRERYHQPIPMYVLPHGPTQMNLMRNTDRHVGCVLCRRFMWRSAEKIAEREGATFLVTGEALGQVASQTLSNMRNATASVKLPIVRPLIGFDKYGDRGCRQIDRNLRDLDPSRGLLPGGPRQAGDPLEPRPDSAEEERIDVDQIIDDCVRKAVIL